MPLNLLKDVECRNATSAGKKVRKLHDGGGLSRVGTAMLSSDSLPTASAAQGWNADYGGPG